VKKISQIFGKFSQEMEYTRAKWAHYGGHMANAEGEHITRNPNFSWLELFLVAPCG